jgi:hypothetical protein
MNYLHVSCSSEALTLEETWRCGEQTYEKPYKQGEANTIARLAKEIVHGEVKEGAYFLLMHTLLCVLHMENRNGLKLLTMVLIEGLSNAKKQDGMYLNINAEGRRVSQFVADIECIINRTILGSDDDPCQWMCPFDTKKKEIGPITMDNVRTRKIVDAMDDWSNFVWSTNPEHRCGDLP